MNNQLASGCGKSFSEQLPGVGIAPSKVSGYTQLTEEIIKVVISVRDRVDQVEKRFSPLLRPEQVNPCHDPENKDPVRSDFETFVAETIRALNTINDRLACIVDRSSI